MKNKKIIIAICLCIPAIIAAIVLIRFNSNDITKSDVLSVTVELDSKQEELNEEADVAFYTSVLDGSTAIDQAAHPLVDYTKLKVTYFKLTKDFEYIFYLSDSPDDCLYSDADGKLYRIDAETARALLARGEMQKVYSSSEIPLMTLKSGDNVCGNPSPSTIDWNYKNVDGDFVNTTDSGNDTQTYTVSKNGLLSMSFTNQPNSCLITIISGTQTLFDGDISTLSNFTADYDCELTMTVKASWLKNDYSDDTQCYGELNYLINIFYDVPASCTVSESTSNPGELLFVRIDNSMNEDFDISADFETANDLKLYDHANGKLALVPIALTAKPGNYNITVKNESNSFSLPITVTTKDFSNVNYDTTASGSDAAAFVSAVKETEDKVKGLSDKASDELSVKAKLSEPLGEADNWICARFGSTVSANGEATELRQNGIGYAVAAGTNVYAPAGGKVIFSENTKAFGHVVVIEHGFGLQSSFYYLGDVTVSEGDTVSANQMIGQVAETGINSGYTSLQFNVSVGGVYVNPASVIYSAFDFFNITSVTENLLGVDPNAVISGSSAN